MNKPTSTTTLHPNMRCTTVFDPCGCTFTTDVPKTYGGEGAYACPADMLAAAVASCMLSMVGLTGKKMGFDTYSITAAAACDESNGRISGITVTFTVPRILSDAEKEALHKAVTHCPVGSALAEHVHKEIKWLYR